MAESRDAFVELQDRVDRPGTPALDRLRAAQSRHGAVRAEDERRIAAELGQPVAAVAGAASFFADLASGPRGRRHIRVCDGTACLVADRGRHIRRLEEGFGVRCGGCAPDGSVSLAKVYCLGYCYAAPSALDGELPCTGAGLGGLLPAGTAAPGGPGPAPPVPFRCAARDAVLLAGLTGAEGPWQVWPRIAASGDPGSVLREVAAAGLRGRGGAGFPVADKWRAVRAGARPRYVVANGDEGDPGSFCDRLLMESDPHRVLEGLVLAGFAVGAERGLLLVRSEYPLAARRLRAAADGARAAGHLGSDVHGSGFGFDVEVVQGAGSYVAGEETALLHTLQGLRGGVRARPPYPARRGFRNRPTAVNNVETLAAVPWIAAHGGAAYARLGRAPETGTKLVSLNERFARPGVFEVEFGTPLRLLVEELGGGLRSGEAPRSVQVGGPLGGFLPPEELDVPLLAADLGRRGVPLGHASLVAVDAGVPARDLLRHLWEFAAAESCGSCSPCRVGSRRGLELARGIGSGAAAPVREALEEQDPVLEAMAVASLCAFGRGVAGAVRGLLRVYGDELRGGR
ncbi:NAD(P)H-dependent oxidoreductase subunit E [Marinitenerispora sediminis]|uniref:Protein disulfide oxidoreductase n=1 Tax=Marinitenerispora sediminis TaxID=1931232 RepID=A0A368T8L3_9ACTN|nr:NAD(P)H-dependent oxidoreductase subunit E [Marinitenerispora sediminis]RCV52036.1 protein disulfide oxidoreductase [Marinitenerispora sediminis]RCV54695.1 protein disulfide oxidoreductase [Marinitenerispora sediminis]RCV60383.1 protein disulfide oxidoreductase [Marinitenerispora sediminis]